MNDLDKTIDSLNNIDWLPALDNISKEMEIEFPTPKGRVLTILEYPAKELEQNTLAVESFDAEIEQLVEDMFVTMLHSNGVGLAANQVGVLKRVLVISIGGDPTKLKEFINPIIVDKKGKLSWKEGCLSFPDYFEFINRSETISVQAQDRFGNSFIFEANQLDAVCLQHEIDHLNGETFLNRMSTLKKGLALKRFRKHNTKT